MDSNKQKKDNVFRNRNFRLVFLGALVSELGAILYSFAVSFYILEISGNNAFLQGLYLALCGAAMLVFTPVGGVMGDRKSKAKIMYVCDYLKGGMILLATALMLLFREAQAQLAILFVLGILGNSVSGIFNPAAGAIFPHIVREEQLQQANSYFTMKNSMESILGVVLAGVLYAVLPIHTLFFLIGVCYIASGVSEMMIRYDFHPPEEQLTLKLAVRDMADGVAYLKTKKAILALLASVLFINFFFAPVTGNFLPFFVKTDLTAAPSYLLDRVLTPELWASVFSVCFGVSSLLGAAILSGRAQAEKCGRKAARLLCAAAAVVIVLTVCYYSFVDRGAQVNVFLIALSVGCLLIGFLISSFNIPVTTAIMRIVDRDKLSKVNSLTSIGSQGMIPIASVLAGAILEAFGGTVLLAFCSVGFAVTAMCLLFSREFKEL
ncbi:MAG: MFS transporter [Oscillospiraceae bacterium]|nr:MFS transporter [Oscillospiraceae bacterium]